MPLSSDLKVFSSLSFPSVLALSLFFFSHALSFNVTVRIIVQVRHALAARLVHASAPDRPQWWALAQDLEATYLTSSSPPGGGGGMASPQAGEV